MSGTERKGGTESGAKKEAQRASFLKVRQDFSVVSIIVILFGGEAQRSGFAAKRDDGGFPAFGKEESVKETHQGFLSRSITAKRKFCQGQNLHQRKKFTPPRPPSPRGEAQRSGFAAKRDDGGFPAFGKEESVKETHQGFLSRSITREAEVLPTAKLAPKKKTRKACLFLWCR